MIKTSYQTPELRDANDNIIQQGAFGKNTALSNSTNDAWIDYVMNDLEALHDTIGDSAPTLDGNGHVVEPANLAIGDEDGVRLKTGYVKTSGGTMTGTLNIAQNLKMQDNQENVFGGMYVPASSATSQYLQIYGGESTSNNGSRLTLFGSGEFNLQAKNGTTAYTLVGNTDGTLKWRGNNVAVTASPAFTGSPTAPTQAVNNSSTRLATTAYVVNDLKANAPLLAQDFVTSLNSETDLNDVTTPGTYIWYGGSHPTNVPSGCEYSRMIVINSYSDYYRYQILFNHGGFIWVRRCNLNNNTWNSWKKIAYAEDVLPLTGGTMTGNITRVTSTSSENFAICNSTITKGEWPTTTKYIDVFAIHASDTPTSTNRLSILEHTVGTSSHNIALRLYKYDATVNAYSFIRIMETNTTAYCDVNVPFLPVNDNTLNLGSGSTRWKQLFAGTTTISTSDERLKDNITAVPDEVLDAWGEVNWYQYQFKDSIEEKGETKARLHTGAIAQRIESIFESHGLDANKYGLLCYDEWKAEPAERDEDGNIVQEARPAGNRYSLRYEEALCMEAAYQRRRADRLEQRLEAIEQRLSALETL